MSEAERYHVLYPDVLPTVEAAARFLECLEQVWSESEWRGYRNVEVWRAKAEDEAFRRYLRLRSLPGKEKT